jgi:diguanylate cyclase (GGDEF)-like protein
MGGKTVMLLIDYLSRQDKSRLLGVAFIFVILIGYLNHLAGMETSVSILYLLPVSLVSWFVGRKEGGFIALASSTSWYAADWSVGHQYSHPAIFYLNLAVIFSFFPIMSFALSGFKKALEKEKKLARVDSLTGVTNSRNFFDSVEKEIERSRRYGRPMTLIYLDCDNFKKLNDKFGHQIGNRFLHLLATTLKSNTRDIDIVARLGGDEFAILMPETGEQIVPHAIQQLHNRLVNALRKMGWPITLSMGAAIHLDPPASAEDLIKSADRLMLQAKGEGKNTVQYKVFGVPKEFGEATLAAKGAFFLDSTIPHNILGKPMHGLPAGKNFSQQFSNQLSRRRFMPSA